jgi:hypothetical protein
MSESDSASSGYWRKTIPAWRQVPLPAPETIEAVAEPVHASEWSGGVVKGAGRPSLTADEMVALGLGFGAHATLGYEKRDTSYQEEQHAAVASTSIGAAPATTRNIVPNRKK